MRASAIASTCGVRLVSLSGPGMAKMISDTHALEREAYRDWIKLKHKISAEYVAGKRKTRPPWGVVR